MQTWLLVVGAGAGALGVGAALPQVVRLCRTRCVAGLSRASAVLGLLAALAWLWYAAAVADPTQLVTNVASTAGAAAVLVLLHRHAPDRAGRTGWLLLGWMALLGALSVGVGAGAVGAAATAVSLVSRVPQLHQAWRGPTLAALSPSSLLLGLASAAGWVVYGLATAQVPVWACSAVSLLLGAAILARRCPPGALRARVGAAGPDAAAPAGVASPAGGREDVTLAA